MQDLIVGLSISGGGIQAVELDRSGPTTTLLSIDEWENTLPAALANGSGDGLQEFQRLFGDFVRENRIRANRLSISPWEKQMQTMKFIGELQKVKR